MSVADCLVKLVADGKISQATADQARDMHERMQKEYTRTGPPATADAAAALEAAKRLRDRSAEKINNIHNQITAYRQGEMRQAEHPAGRLAALAGMITRDLWRDSKTFLGLPDTSPVKTGSNIDYLSRTISRDLSQQFGLAIAKYKPGFFGAGQEQVTGVSNMIREIFGVDTGDAEAKAAAKAWADATDKGVLWAKEAGKIFTTLDDWRIMQHWRGSYVKNAGFDAFRADFLQEEAKNGLVIFDRDTGKPVTAANKEFVIRRAYDDITGTGGATAPFSRESRTFNFQGGEQGATSYMRLMEKYGYGNNPLMGMVGHLERMGREIGTMRVAGPNPDANFAAWLADARRQPAIPVGEWGSGLEKYNPARIMAKFLENPRVIQGMWEVARGRVHPTEDDFTSGLLGALRNMSVATSLRQAIVPVALTDTVTSFLAANHMGMEGIGYVARLFSRGLSREDAAHMNIQAHSMADYVNGIRDRENHLSMMQLTGKMGSAVTRLTGLDWWSGNVKRSWAGGVLKEMFDQRGLAFDQLNPNRQRFMSSYGLTPSDWDRLRAGPHTEMNGARYLDPAGMPRDLYERLMPAIEEQGAFAAHQPDLRLRSIETGAAYGFTGQASEMMRTAMQFKTFALSRMSTQLMRIFTSGPIENRVFRGAAFTILSTAAGAVALQTQQILNGKDPFDMDRPDFWAQAFAKGGTAGYYTDLVEAALHGERSVGDIMTALAGPGVSLVTDAMRMAAAPIHEEFDPATQNVRRSSLGGQVIGLAKRMTPETFYTKLAVDRLIYDQLQTLVDPNYRTSWQRMEAQQRKRGSGYWWAPGETAPERAPSFTH